MISVLSAALNENEQLSGNGTIYTLKTAADSRGTVVCVHGIGSFSAQYIDIASFLHNLGYTVVTYDLIGRGRSSYPNDNVFDGEAHVDQLRGLVTELNLHEGKRYHIIAHSMGGAVAALYASQYLSEVASLVLLSPAGLMDLGILRLLRGCCGCFQSLAKRGVAAGQEQAWRDDFVSHDGKSLEIENMFTEKLRRANQENPRMYDAFWQSALQFPLSGIDSSVQAVANCEHLSILLMWGEQDKAVPYNPNYFRWRRYFESTTAPSKLVRYAVYENMGHGFLLEHADAVHEAIRDFFEEIKSSQIAASAVISSETMVRAAAHSGSVV